MTHFIRNGDIYRVASETSLIIDKELPAGTFTIGFDKMTGSYYFEKIEDFPLTPKLYGETQRHADRIINTFKDRLNSTGVLLCGEKGSGKTLLAKVIANQCRTEGIPTIVLNQPFVGDDFNAFIQAVDQPAIILFDEFEKVYNREQQEGILTLLDGVYPSKKLFILTCNDQYRLDTNLRNRPGRIYYSINFVGLSREFIIEYCQDRLENKQYIDDVVRVSSVFESFNFDMLKALVEEMNRYNETPTQAMEILNAQPQKDSGEFSITLKYDNEIIPNSDIWPRTLTGSPVTRREIRLDVDAEDDRTDYVVFSISDLKRIDENTGAITFSNDDGYWAEFRPLQKYNFKMSNIF